MIPLRSPNIHGPLIFRVKTFLFCFALSVQNFSELYVVWDLISLMIITVITKTWLFPATKLNIRYSGSTQRRRKIYVAFGVSRAVERHLATHYLSSFSFVLSTTTNIDSMALWPQLYTLYWLLLSRMMNEL